MFGLSRLGLRRRQPEPKPEPVPDPPRPKKRLFLDDDPERASLFLGKYPEAVWVTAADECIGKLAVETWDEVHLDHDLGGERFVDVSRDDCGMAVVRWLALEPRDHLKPTRFLVHSHNASAAFVMVLQMRSLGFKTESRPFGYVPPPPKPKRRPARAVVSWLSRKLLSLRKVKASDEDSPAA